MALWGQRTHQTEQPGRCAMHFTVSIGLSPLSTRLDPAPVFDYLRAVGLNPVNLRFPTYRPGGLGEVCM